MPWSKTIVFIYPDCEARAANVRGKKLQDPAALPYTPAKTVGIL